MIPIARHVNKNELPPILTSGSVTPVTGNKFTFTAILISAWITKVKLRPSARNAPNAYGHFLNIRILRYKKHQINKYDKCSTYHSIFFNDYCINKIRIRMRQKIPLLTVAGAKPMKPPFAMAIFAWFTW